MEAIHNFVEVLNKFFTNVCELDLLFNFHQVRGPANRAEHCGLRGGGRTTARRCGVP